MSHQLTDITNTGTKAAACAYVLHILLQRLEEIRPGLVLELLQGVKSDRTAVESNGAMSEPVGSIFREAERMLELIHAQNQMAPSQGKK